MQQAQNAGVSVALWGTPWPYQTATVLESGRERMARFWLGPKNERSQPQSGIAAVVTPRPVPPVLPFCTSFNTGRGSMFMSAAGHTPPNGHFPWSNMGLQDVLPTYWDAQVVGSGSNGASFSWELTETIAYDGGSSLAVLGATAAGVGDAAVFNLFSTAFPSSESLGVRMIVGGADTIDLALGFVGDQSNDVTLLVPTGGSGFSSVNLGPSFSPGPLFSPYDEGPTGSFYFRDYVLPAGPSGSTITDIMLVALPPSGSFASGPTATIGTLGRIAIGASGQFATPPGPVGAMSLDPNWQMNSKGIPSMNGTLSWDQPDPSGTVVRSYDVSWLNNNATQYWLGRVTAPMFVLNDLAYWMDSGNNVASARFVVQAIGMNGAALWPNDAASLDFTWQTVGPTGMIGTSPVYPPPGPAGPFCDC